jgi:hypothetical protein
MDKLELAERLEAATWPDRALDWEIHCRDGLEGVGAYGPHPAYTASLDAAMTLVPEDMAWSVDSGGPTYPASAEIGNPPTGGEMFNPKFSADGATPALALCAASLRARDEGGRM